MKYENGVYTGYELKLVRSAIPVYCAVAAGGICFFITFSHISAGTVAVSLVVAAIAYLLLGIIFPPTLVREAVPHFIRSSGDGDTDRMICEAYTVLREIEASGFDIVHYSEQLASDIAALTGIIRRILAYLEIHPERIALARRFITRVMPMLSKICSAYTEFARTDTGAETRDETERSVAGMKESFRAQLDTLYADRELDISSDITVLETLLRRDSNG